MYANERQLLWKDNTINDKDIATCDGNVQFMCLYCNGSFGVPYTMVKMHLLKLTRHVVRVYNKISQDKYINFKKLEDPINKIFILKSSTTTSEWSDLLFIGVDKKKKVKWQ